MSAPVRFDGWMRDALYGPEGFYTRGGRAGRRGDFLTSPEVGPLFGAVLARALDTWWEELGRPDPYVVVDAGAGPGTLARAVLAAAPVSAPTYVAVETSEAQRASHPDGVTSTDTLPDDAHVVVANELLDNVPFRLLVFDGGWREAWVDDGREVLRPFDEPVPSWLPETSPHGARVPWQQEAAWWVDRACAIAPRVLVLDYARETTAEMARLPWRQWLRTYRGHERGGHYLTTPGEQDVTADLAIDQLAPPSSVTTQADFLRAWGIDDLVDEGRREWTANAARPTLAAIAMRSRVREAEALLDPNGLGAHLALEWRR
jgi:SAM-dependent MidA family methyltransferase